VALNFSAMASVTKSKHQGGNTWWEK